MAVTFHPGRGICHGHSVVWWSPEIAECISASFGRQELEPIMHDQRSPSYSVHIGMPADTPPSSETDPNVLITDSPEDLDRPVCHCGVVGIFNHPEAAVNAYYALHSLQHRGQEAAG